jgi:hypothetical protein
MNLKKKKLSAVYNRKEKFEINIFQHDGITLVGFSTASLKFIS